MNTSRTNRNPGVTYEQAVTDSVYKIPAAKLKNEGGQQAVYARILVLDEQLNEAFGVDPEQGAAGTLFFPIAVDSVRELFGFNEIQAWRSINNTAATTSNLVIQIYYR